MAEGSAQSEPALVAVAVDEPPVFDDVTRVGPYRVHGHGFVIETNVPEMARQLDDRLRDLRTTPADDVDTHFLVARRGPSWMTHPWGVWRNGQPCETTLTGEYIQPYVLWEVTRLLLETCRPLIPIHAAAVARDGQAIVLAGVSHAGKSTLAGWLTAHGWQFLTDEVALLERRPDGSVWVHPFWRPIGVRRPGPLDDLITPPTEDPEVLVPASALGALGQAAPLRAIVLPSRDADVERTLQPQHPASTARELATHLPRLGEDGRAGFRDIVAVVESIPAFALGVDDLTAAAATLATLVEHGPAA